MRPVYSLCIACLLAVFCASDAWADNAPTTQPLAISFNPPFADKDRWSFELLGTGIGDVSNRHVAMGGITAGIGYYFWDRVAVTLDVSSYGFNQGHSNGAATGVTLGLRHHLFSFDKTSVFVDCSGGEIEASNNLPAGGTHLNNTIEAGLGVAHPISENTYLLTGVRYFHLSNAGSEGSDRNPSINGIQGVLGVMWKF